MKRKSVSNSNNKKEKRRLTKLEYNNLVKKAEIFGKKTTIVRTCENGR